MPSPYNYTVAQPDVGTYFDAVRQGRADRRQVEKDDRENALSRYLPDALAGDAAAQQQAMGAANPDQMIALKNTFNAMSDRELARRREYGAKAGALALSATDPARWDFAQKVLREEFPDVQQQPVPFEMREALIAKAQTVAEVLEQTWKERSFKLDESRTRAQNAASYASADASRASAEYTRAGKTAPGGRTLTAPMNKEFGSLGDQLATVRKATGSFKDEYASRGLFGMGGEAMNLKDRVFGSSNASVWWQNYDRYKNEVRNELFGSALTPSEQAAFESADITPNMDAGQIRANLKIQQDVVEGALTRRARSAVVQGYNPQAVEFLTGLDQQSPAQPIQQPQAAQPAQGGAPLVRSKAEFDALPRGAVYVEPDGKRYRKP